MIEITEIMRASFENAKEKGFRYNPEIQERTFPEDIALMHSELSEALEAYRDPNNRLTDSYRASDTDHESKPEGVATELADVIIRICECCEFYDIPLEWAIRSKLLYNKTRPYRHGGKRL